MLVSLDVTSLFTNVPKDLVFKAIENRWSDIARITKFNLPQFLHAIDVILDSTSFSFNGVFYDQIFGTPMGSPVSPILADLVLDDLEVDCLKKLSFEVSVFHRYVDDIFTILPTDKVDEVVSVFNNYHPRLKFTYETEIDGVINFLDTKVIRDGDRLITDWHRKPTFSGRYVNFYSSHPLRYKINTIVSLVDRAVLLSDERFHDKNIQLVKSILANNCFPSKLVNKHINIRINELNSRHCTGLTQRTISDTKNFITLPYFDKISDNISRKLCEQGFRTLFTVPKKLDQFIKTGKDSLKKKKK